MVNLNLSNGTCYFAQQTETNGDFIPCGNIALGNWPCCKAGDVCLGFESANACYDYNSTNTYIAGCTDPTYGDSTCPQKNGFGDQEWVAIQHCGTDASSGDTNWGGCKNNPANDTALTKLANSMCDPYCASTTLWVGGSTIEAYATVPTAAGGSITWTNDFNPATTTRVAGGAGAGAATTTTRSSSTATSTGSSATATNSTSGKDEDSGGLDTGAKIGIGIGSAGAALLIVAVVLLALLVRRRRNRKRAAAAEQLNGPGQAAFVDGAPHPFAGQGGGGNHHGYAGHGIYAVGADAHKQQHNNPDLSYAGVHYKHELPADDGGRGILEMGASRSPVLSLGGSTTATSPDYMSVSNASTLQAHSQQGTGTTGGSGGFHVSPQSTGTTTGYGGAAYATGGSGRAGETGPISEMQA